MSAKTVRIGSIDYEIIRKDKIYNPESDIHVNGAIFFSKCEIQIWSELPKQKQFEVFNHECLHGIIEATHISIPEKFEEKLVLAMTPVYTSLLRDNWRLLQRMGELK